MASGIHGITSFLDQIEQTGIEISSLNLGSDIHGTNVRGIAGSAIALINDGKTLYKRGCQLHELRKKVEVAKKEHPDSLTHRFLERQKDFQRWLVASSVVNVIADGASLGGVLFPPAGVATTIGSTAVTALSIAGEDHLNENFKKDLMEFCKEFTEKHPHVESDPHFEKTYQRLKQKYENAKAEHERANKAVEEITKKIANQKGKIPAEELEALVSQQNRDLETLETAVAALKKIENGYKHMHEIHEDFQSYKSCKILIQDMQDFFKTRDHLKSEIATFEDAYKKEMHESFEPYKSKHFGQINPAWQKRFDAYKLRLNARHQSYTAELQTAESHFRAAEKRLHDIISKMDDLKFTMMNNDGSNRAIGSPRNDKILAKARAEYRKLEPLKREAALDFGIEYDKARAIRKTIRENKDQQKALMQYAKNWKNLSKAREKIMVKNRGIENGQAILSADKMLKEQLPTQTLLSERNRLKLEQHQALHKLQKAEEPIVENEELDIVRRGTVEEPVSFVEKHEVPHSTLKDHHPTPIITKFAETEQPIKPVTPTAKDDASPTEPDYSKLEDLLRTKIPATPLSPPTFSIKTEEEE